MPDTAGYAVQGAQLAQELEDVASSSRRSTLRRHYTPGDYMRYASDARYASDTEGYSGSLRRQRRTLSASNVARGQSPSPSGKLEVLSSTADRSSRVLQQPPPNPFIDLPQGNRLL